MEPGVGKTTLTNALVILLKQKGIKFLLTAPTGRAAKRIEEATGEQAKTIHRLLGFDPRKGGFLHNAEIQLNAEIIIVDEASMLDLPLFHSLLSAIQPSSHLVLIGDSISCQV